MNSELIGTATVNYEEGNATSVTFRPTIVTITDKELLDTLNSFEDRTSKEFNDALKLILASWFNTVNAVELADMTKYELTAERGNVHPLNDVDSFLTVRFRFGERQ